MIDAVFRRFQQNSSALNSSDVEILHYERGAILGSRTSLAISKMDLGACNESFPNSRFELFPIIRNFERGRFEFKENRFRILFVGSMLHTPNLMALNFILKKIAPKVEELNPNLIFTIVGTGTDNCDVYSNNVDCLGIVDNLEEIYSESLFSLAPMSIAAGINGKVIESINFGVVSLVSKAVFLNLSESMKIATVVCDSVNDYVQAIVNTHSKKLGVSPRIRSSVAEEVDGRTNSLVLRKYLR